MLQKYGGDIMTDRSILTVYLSGNFVHETPIQWSKPLNLRNGGDIMTERSIRKIWERGSDPENERIYEPEK